MMNMMRLTEVSPATPCLTQGGIFTIMVREDCEVNEAHALNFADARHVARIEKFHCAEKESDLISPHKDTRP